MFRELYNLLQSLAAAVRGLTWVMLLLVVTNYVCAVLLTVLIGSATSCPPVPVALQDSATVAAHAEVGAIEAACLLDYQWGKVPRSMFTLFIVMTGEGWNEIALAAMAVHPAMSIFFIVFVAFTNFCVMNLVIGVLVEKIMSSTQQQQKEAGLKPTWADFVKLSSVFEALDDDGDGFISTMELLRVTEDEEIRSRLAELNIYCGTDPALLMQMWDQDCSGQLDLREFVEGAMRIRKSEQAQQLLMLQHDLHSYSRTLLDQLQALENLLRQRAQLALEDAPSPDETRQTQRKFKKEASTKALRSKYTR